MQNNTQIAFILNGSAALAARDFGIQRASYHTEAEYPGWAARTIDALRIFCADAKSSGKSEFTFEQFRAIRQHDAPASHKAWGSIPRIAAAAGIIEWTGRYELAKSIKTHGHPVKLWRAK